MIGDFIQMERVLKRVRSIYLNMAIGAGASKKAGFALLRANSPFSDERKTRLLKKPTRDASPPLVLAS